MRAPAQYHAVRSQSCRVLAVCERWLRSVLLGARTSALLRFSLLSVFFKQRLLTANGILSFDLSRKIAGGLFLSALAAEKLFHLHGSEGKQDIRRLM